MVCLDVILSLLFGNGLPSKDQVIKLWPAVYGFKLGFWVERDWGHGPRCWVRVQGPNGSGHIGAVH